MTIKKAAAKLEKYQQRLSEGKAHKIKPKHLNKMIAKLAVKEGELTAEIAETAKPDRKERLENKLATIRERINEAEWLLDQI